MKYDFHPCLYLLLVCAFSRAAWAAQPNVVVILTDDQGWGDLSVNGNTNLATPNIDSLARDGMRFTDAHAPGPLCHMSRYGLLTGRYPFRTDVSRWRNLRISVVTPGVAVTHVVHHDEDDVGAWLRIGVKHVGGNSLPQGR